jgi:hypothetical protein
LGQCSRLETPNALAGRWSDRIRRTSDSGKGPISAVPLASAITTGLRGPETLGSASSPFSRHASPAEIFVVSSSPPASCPNPCSSLAPWGRCIRRNGHLAPFRAGTQRPWTTRLIEGPTEDRVFGRKASSAAGKRVVSSRLVIFRLVCLARDAPQRSPRASLSPRKLDEPRWQVPACSSCSSISSSFTVSTSK